MVKKNLDLNQNEVYLASGSQGAGPSSPINEIAELTGGPSTLVNSVL